MNAADQLGFYQYEDSELSMQIPSYIRPKKGIRFFASKSKRDRSQPLLNIGVELPNEDLSKAIWSTIVNAKPSEWMGVRQSIVRRGKAAYLINGLELLMSSSHDGPGGEVHNYHILFLIGDHRVHATFVGHGAIDVFDNLCRQIVSSVRVGGVGDALVRSNNCTP